MSLLETMTVIAPAHWASALVNDDASGLSDEESAALDAWFYGLRAELGFAVDQFYVTGDVGESYSGVFNRLGTSVCEYTIAFTRCDTEVSLSTEDRKLAREALVRFAQGLDELADAAWREQSSDESHAWNLSRAQFSKRYRQRASEARKVAQKLAR